MSLSALGVLHTIIGIAAVVSAFMLLWQDKQILPNRVLGKVYLLATIVTAASALGIYKHGSFNTAHALAVLTILAAVAGVVAGKLDFLGAIKKYFVALCFTSTLLFHLLPTATEILTRFPVDAPVVSSLQDPFLQKTFAVIFVAWLVGLALQMNWLRKQP